MKRLLFLAVTVATAAAFAAAQAAWTDPPAELNGPPTANWFGIYPCAAQGGSQVVTAGEPFAVRLGAWVSGTRGLVESFIPKDASTLTVERPLGTTAVSVPFQWQLGVYPNDPYDGLWAVWRWSPVFTLAAGEQMTVTFTAASALPARDLVPPSSTWDPTSAGFPPYDGTGLKYDGGVTQPFTTPPVSCTITGV